MWTVELWIFDALPAVVKEPRVALRVERSETSLAVGNNELLLAPRAKEHELTLGHEWRSEIA